MRETARGAVATAQRLTVLARADRDRIAEEAGRIASTVFRIHHALLQRAIQTAPQLARSTKLSMPAVNKGLEALIAIGIVRELTGRRRNRVFSYAPYVGILSEGTEPL